MANNDFQQALELRRKQIATARNFRNSIRWAEGDIGYIRQSEIPALETALEQCTIQEIAEFIRELANEIDDKRFDLTDEAFERSFREASEELHHD